MDLLQMTKPLTNDHPYLKAAFQGFQGSGKTFTAMIVAAGLHDQLGGAQIVIYDTEIASAFLMPQFEKRGIKGVRNIKSRSLKNLTNVIDAAEKFDKPVILLIDSITHVWKNLVYEWKTQKRKSYLTMHDWGILIPKWEEEFSRRFLESKVHIIFTGRAGYSYDDQENEETGKKELKKTGTRMKVQGETGFEPSLLVEMEQHQEAGKSGKSKKVYVTATILKDRYDIINGQTFRNPTFAKFKPVINQVLSGTAAGPVFQDSREEFTIMNAGSEWKAKKRPASRRFKTFSPSWASATARTRSNSSSRSSRSCSRNSPGRQWSKCGYLSLKKAWPDYGNSANAGRNMSALRKRPWSPSK